MPNSSTRPTAPTRSRSATPTATICVVDPAAEDYRDCQSLAAARGARLHIVASGEEALRFSRTTPVDLWLVNIELPNLSGFDLCRMLKSRSRASTVYLVADEYSPEAERAAWASRASLFGCKPQHGDWLCDWNDKFFQVNRVPNPSMPARLRSASAATNWRTFAL